MRRFVISGVCLGLFFPGSVFAQAVDNGLSYRNINEAGYARLTYENDYFSATDFYYTQGLHLEFVTPVLKKFPLFRLLVHPHIGQTKWGLAIEHDAYTPTSITSDVILKGDRPFSAALFLKSFLIVTDSVRKDRFYSSLSVGVIGPAAGGNEMQTGIHRWINGIHPHGWKYQIKNDLVLNYQVDYERKLLNFRDHFLVNGFASARLGSLSDKAGLGVTAMAGYFNNPFIITKRDKKLRIYIYDHPEVGFIGYDATLQGGLFTGNDPYTLPSDDIKRLTFSNRFGVVLTYKGLYLEYWTDYISKEFKTAMSHRTGGIQIGIGF